MKRAISEVGVAGCLVPAMLVATPTALGIDGVDAAELSACSTFATAPTPPPCPTRSVGSMPGEVGVADRRLATSFAATSTPPGDTAEALPREVTTREMEEMPSVAELYFVSGSATTLGILLERVKEDGGVLRGVRRRDGLFTSGMLRAPHAPGHRPVSRTVTLMTPVGQNT